MIFILFFLIILASDISLEGIEKLNDTFDTCTSASLKSYSPSVEVNT